MKVVACFNCYVQCDIRLVWFRCETVI